MMSLSIMRGMVHLWRGSHLRNLCYEHTRNRKKPALGGRILKQPSRVFDFNAWDNVEWKEEQIEEARAAVAKNSAVTLSEANISEYDTRADNFWDNFYDIHQNRFFKDRHWLFTEFPELNPAADAPAQQIFEIGCGVGNTVFPILNYNRHAKMQVFASDFSSRAIEILKESPDYDQSRCEAFVLDATADEWTVPFAVQSIDIIVLIFVLSAIHPDKMQHVVNQCSKYLKPGGRILLRDYGRYDLAQLRFKPGKCLQENFYVRGDGTRVYFFTQDELQTLFETAGLVKEQNLVDRRLQVNRGRQLKMYRVWVQTKYRKPACK